MNVTRRKIALMTTASCLVFLIFSLIVHLDLTEPFDRALLLSLRVPGEPGNPIGPTWFEEAAVDITALGGYPVITLFGVMILLFLWSQGRLHDIRFLLLTVLTGTLVSNGLKLLFSRPRPDLVGQFDKVFTSSFPSGHAMMSTVVYLSLAIVIVREVKRVPARRVVIWSALTVIFLISMSRVYLGVHWPTDVLAGWAAGGAWVGICWLVLERNAGVSSPVRQ